MRRVNEWREIFAAYDAVHGPRASLREGLAILPLMAAFGAIALALAAMAGGPA